MRVVLFKNSEASFLNALNEAGISYSRVSSVPGSMMASGAMIILAQTVAVSGAVAAVLVAWIKARSSRKIILTLRDNKILHLEGYTVKQVEDLLPLVEQLAAIDTESTEKSNNSLESRRSTSAAQLKR